MGLPGMGGDQSGGGQGGMMDMLGMSGGIGDMFSSPENSVGGGGAFGMLSGGNTPQDRGFGIQAPADFQQYSTGGGLTQGDPTGMESLDMTTPGWGEQFFAGTSQNFGGPGAGEAYFGEHANDFTKPGQAQGFYDQNAHQAFANQGLGEKTGAATLNQFGDGRNPGVTNNQSTEYQHFAANRPNVGNDANLGAFYDNAQKRSLESLGRQAASRGVYGTSSALDNESRAITDLNAQRARDEADYVLKASGENRAWDALGGQLAGQSDQGSQAQSQNQLAWTQGLNNIASNAQNLDQSRNQAGIASALGLDKFGLDQLNSGQNAAQTSQGLALNRLQQGQNAANNAQQLQQGRGNDLFQHNMQLSNGLSSAAGDTYDNMFGGDQALMDSSIASELGLGAEALNQDYRNQQRQKDDAQWAADMWGSIMPMMGGMGG